jgi:hypothetical protein
MMNNPKAIDTNAGILYNGFNVFVSNGKLNDMNRELSLDREYAE